MSEERFKVTSREVELVEEETVEEIRVDIDENGQIYNVRIDIDDFAVEGNPHNPETISNADYAFEKMMKVDLNTFKALLRRIKDSDPEMYERGSTILNNEKERIMQEANKFSLD